VIPVVSDKAQWLRLAEFEAKKAAVVVHWVQTDVEALHCRLIADTYIQDESVENHASARHDLVRVHVLVPCKLSGAALSS
jgi:hypothetical protein